MKNKMKRALMLSAIPLVLLGCTNGANDSDTPDNETDDQETVKEEVKISNVEVNVQSGITEAVEQIDDAVVSVINLQRNDFSSWAGFYGMRKQVKMNIFKQDLEAVLYIK